MSSSPDAFVDINLFKNNFIAIDKEFIQSIVSIASLFGKNNEYIFITNDNSTYAYGKEICSWLSFVHDPKQPQRISLLNDKKIIQVDYGYDFVVILTIDGQVYMANATNSEWNRTFRLINSDCDDRFKMIACGLYHLLLLRQDGTVFAMGANECGQITGHLPSSYDKMINIGLENIERIACGQFHSLALTNSGKIYSWGRNKYGELGLGDRKDQHIVSIVSFPNVDDQIIDCRIKDIAAGQYHSLFLMENGQLYRCGNDCPITFDDNEKNIALTPTKISNIECNATKMACSKDYPFSFILLKSPSSSSSQYYGWGNVNNKKHWQSPRKLDEQLESFSAASASIFKSPITFGLTSTIYVFESQNSISSYIQLFNRYDNYDFKFIIRNQSIFVSRCYLKMVSKHFHQLFCSADDWLEKTEIEIEKYSYNTYYAYLGLLHDCAVRIDRYNLKEFIDLAIEYKDERLMDYCHKFIQNDLDKKTLANYFSLIKNYQLLNQFHIQLGRLTIDEILPKIVNKLVENQNDSIEKFLEWFFHQQTFIEKEI